MAEFFKLESDTSVNYKFFSRSIETAQRKVEGNNYSIRKNVVEFDNVLNRQKDPPEPFAPTSHILLQKMKSTGGGADQGAKV